jgi:hypothetical protein
MQSTRMLSYGEDSYSHIMNFDMNNYLKQPVQYVQDKVTITRYKKKRIIRKKPKTEGNS